MIIKHGRGRKRMSNNFFIDGFKIPTKVKVFTVIIGFLLMIINHNLSTISSGLDYQYRSYVTLAILAVMVIISLGSKAAEGTIIGLAIFAIMSAVWDFSVLDITDLRFHILIGGVIVLFISVFFGRISIFNMFSIAKKQLGVK